jgi:tetratricopeptide (TPR) repeat protein
VKVERLTNPGAFCFDGGVVIAGIMNTRQIPEAYGPSDPFTRMRTLYEAGFFVQAADAAKELGDPLNWEDPQRVVLGARILMRTGDEEGARGVVLRAWRREPDSAILRDAILWEIAARRGPFFALQRAKAWQPLHWTCDQQEAEYLAFVAFCLARLRDFESADAMLVKARHLAPELAWTLSLYAQVRLAQDRFAEALDFAEQALSLAPFHTSAALVCSAAHVALGRDDTALNFLENAAASVESGPIALAHADLLFEVDAHAQAARALDRYLQLSPNLRGCAYQGYAARRFLVHYNLDQIEAAVGWARAIEKSDFHREVAERLESGSVPSSQRVVLPMPFVAQHHLTCAPATLTALARYWGRAVNHLQLADEICYDGTSHYSQRKWAEQNGWVVRNFRVSWESTRALIDRQIPFGMATVGVDSAHMQAVIGYDALQKTLLIRDPYTRSKRHFVAEPLFEEQAFYGPWGLVMVPQEEAWRLENLELDDVAQYERYHRFSAALAEHNRDAAFAIVSEMQADASQSLVTLSAMRALAGYDDDNARILEVVRRQRQAYPDDLNLILAELRISRALLSSQKMSSLLEPHGSADDVALPLLLEWAKTKLWDARAEQEVGRCLRRYLRMGMSAQALLLLGRWTWRAGNREEAVDLYRLACCYDDKDESLADQYFQALRTRNRPTEAIAFLRKRADAASKRSSLPIQTLIDSLVTLGQTEEARQELSAALESRPDDGSLLLFASHLQTSWGQDGLANDLRERARPLVSTLTWLRADARASGWRVSTEVALARWQKVLQLAPLDMVATAAYANLLRQSEGTPRALQWLAARCEDFPHHLALRRIYAQWLRERPANERVHALEHLVELDPDNAWIRRELSLAWISLEQWENALVQAKIAEAIEPDSAATQVIRGQIALAMGAAQEAFEYFQRAIEIEIECPGATSGLVAAASALGRRGEAIAAIFDRFGEQPFHEGTLPECVELARGHLSPQALLAAIERVNALRPDVFETWALLTVELLAQNDLVRSQEVAAQVVERFDFLPGSYLNAAKVWKAAGRTEEYLGALRKAVELEPTWGYARRQLSRALVEVGRGNEARAVLELGLAQDQSDPLTHLEVARLDWADDERERALTRLASTCTKNIDADEAWSTLLHWCNVVEQPQLAVAAARRLTHERPNEYRSWLRLSRALEGPRNISEKIEVLQHACELAPANGSIRSELARAFFSAGRCDEALQICHAWRSSTADGLDLAVLEAEILDAGGQRKAAIEALEKVVTIDPSVARAWQWLADWNVALGDFAKAEVATKKVVELAPLAAHPWVYLADLARGQQKLDDARIAYKKALELEPNYAYAAFAWFELEREGNHAQAALAALKSVAESHAAEVWARRWRLWHQLENRDEEAQAWYGLLLCDDDSAAAFAYVESNVPTSARHLRRMVKWSESVLFRSPRVANLRAGALWSLVRGRAKMAISLVHFRRLPADQKLRQHAFSEALGQNAENFPATSTALLKRPSVWYWKWHVRQLVRKFGEDFRHDALCWGRVTYALYQTRDHAQLKDWAHDWRVRADVEPWMLSNVALSLQKTGRFAESREVIAAALLHPWRDAYHPRFVLLEKIHRIASDETVIGGQKLPGEMELQSRNYELVLLKFVELIVSCEDDILCPRPPRSEMALALALAEFEKLTAQDAVFLRALKRGVAKIAKDSSLAHRLWLHAWLWRKRIRARLRGPLRFAFRLIIAANLVRWLFG